MKITVFISLYLPPKGSSFKKFDTLAFGNVGEKVGLNNVTKLEKPLSWLKFPFCVLFLSLFRATSNNVFCTQCEDGFQPETWKHSTVLILCAYFVTSSNKKPKCFLYTMWKRVSAKNLKAFMLRIISELYIYLNF